MVYELHLSKAVFKNIDSFYEEEVIVMTDRLVHVLVVSSFTLRTALWDRVVIARITFLVCDTVCLENHFLSDIYLSSKML